MHRKETKLSQCILAHFRAVGGGVLEKHILGDLVANGESGGGEDPSSLMGGRAAAAGDLLLGHPMAAASMLRTESRGGKNIDVFRLQMFTS